MYALPEISLYMRLPYNALILRDTCISRNNRAMYKW